MRTLFVAIVFFVGLCHSACAQIFPPNNGGSSATPASEYTIASPFSSGVGPTANGTKLWNISFPTAASFTKVSYTVFGPDNTAATYDLGFYSAAGTLICHVGATPGTTFAPSGSLITLTFGQTCIFTANTRYLLALTGSSATATIYTGLRANLAQAGVSPSAGGTTTGGALNSSITPAADAYSNAGALPALTLHN